MLPDEIVVFCFVPPDVIAMAFPMVLKSCVFSAPLNVVQVSGVLYMCAKSDKVKQSGRQWCHV